MRTRLLAVVLVLLVITLPSRAQEPAKPPAPPSSRERPAKPSFPPIVEKKLHATRDVRGKAAPKLTVSKWLTAKPETKGKVVLIDFWATWCGPCRRLIPELEAWQEKFKDDLVVIGISDEKASVVGEHFKASSMKYAMAVDTAATMKKHLGVTGIPHVLIIGSDNIVRWQGFPDEGSDRLTEAKVKRIIDADKARVAAEKEQAPKPQATKPDGSKGENTKPAPTKPGAPAQNPAPKPAGG